MKKTIVLAVAAAMLAGTLTGCSSGGGSAPAATTAPAATEAPAAGQEAKAEAPGNGGTKAEDETVEIIYVAHGLEDMFCNWLVSCVEDQIAENYPN